MKIKMIVLLVLVMSLFTSMEVKAQTKVGLDNWFNNETNAKTGKPFHYLWTDTAFSGYSRWGKIFEKNGAVLSTLKKPTPAELAKINIYIIVDPDTTTENPAPNYVEKDDAEAIVKWVKNGGVLIMLTNDAPNCEFLHINQLAANFGMTFNHVTLHAVTGNQYDMGASINLPNHPLFTDVKKIYLKEISSIKIWGPAKPVLTENGNVLMSEAQVGKGYVFAVGDPWIYNEYMDHDKLPASFDNHKAAENLTKLLMSKVPANKK
jgi:unsaturated rhamnogalacturonyl hydrolase